MSTSPLPSVSAQSEEGAGSRSHSPGPSSQKPSQRFLDEKDDSDASGSDDDLERRFVAMEDEKEDDKRSDEDNLEDTAVDVSDDSDDDGAEKEEGLQEVPIEVTPEKPQERLLTVSDTLTCLALGLWLVRAPFTYAELAE